MSAAAFNHTARPAASGTKHRRVIRKIGSDFETIGDHSYRNCSVIHFDGREYVFSHRAILTLVTTAGCNAACKFCSNEVTFTPSGPYLSHNDRLERTLAFAELAGVKKVAFTGGEPTAAPQRLYDLVKGVAPRFERGRLHTNGVGLRRPVKTPEGERELLPALIDVGVTGASISVASHDPSANREIMRLTGSWTGMSEDDLRYVTSFSNEEFSPRLSCVLTEEGVRTAKDIDAYIGWGRELGFRRFIFRSCSQIPDEFVKETEFSEYNEASYIPIDPLVEKFRSNSMYRETFSQHKSDSHVHVFQGEDGVVVDIDASSEEVDPDPKIRRLNVMPDGVTYTSWIDPRSFLFPDESETVLNSLRRELPLLAGRVAGGVT